jgi:YYY domain-containing protein
MTRSVDHKRQSSRVLVITLLLLILLAGFVLRVFHVDYADGQLPHPDERSTVAFYAPSIRWPAEGVSPLDKRQAPLNPLWSVERQERRSYTYGHFPLYLLVLTANAAHGLAPVVERLGAAPEVVESLRTANGVPGFAVVGRVIMAVADTLTVLLIFLLADHIYGRRRGRWWPGLLAAAFSAFTVLQIQLSHFFAVDPISTTFTVLAIYGALRMVEAGRGRMAGGNKRANKETRGNAHRRIRASSGAAWAVVTGIGAGLAIASKFSALPILAAPMVAGFLIWWRNRRADRDEQPGGSHALLLPLVALAAAVVTFAITSPFAILDWANFRQAVLVEQGAMVQGTADFPFTRQYRGTLPYLYFIEQQIRWGIGWPLGILAFVGLAWALLKFVIGRGEDGEIIILSWIVPYFGLTGLFLAKFMRYMAPVTPLLMVFAAGLVTALWYGEVMGRRSREKRARRESGSEALSVDDSPRPDAATPPEPGLSSLASSSEALPVDDSPRPDAATPPEPGLSSPASSSEALSVDDSPRPDAATPPEPGLSSLANNREYAPHFATTLRRALAIAIAAVALLGAIFWSLAYVNGVYNNTHPWIKASQWIYANVPDGSTVAWEQWDDSLPYDLPKANSSRARYNFIDWGPFEEDRAEKFEWLKSTLRAADYLVLSSNRIYGAVDNLPDRYPLTNRYYELLFAGQLGYELALKEENRPNLLGSEFDDEHADESFTLYDHPTVHVFRKVRDLDGAEWDALLGDSWEGAKPWYVGEPLLISRVFALFSDEAEQPASSEPGPGEGRSLLLEQPLDELPVVQDFRWNRVASQSPILATLVWWLAISLIGLVTWPMTFALLTNLRDRGFLLSRSLGWLVVGWIVWLVASLRFGHNSLPFIAAAVIGMAVVSTVVWRRNRSEMGSFVRAHKRILLFGEGLFAAAYLFFVVIRIFNPDIWQPWNGGEKFMEFAFLNAILRSANMPPIDPYFAGGVINYYYYGHYLVNLLIKLTGIWSSVAFNLAIPTVFALTVANVFSLGYNLAGRMRQRAEICGQKPEAGGQEVREGEMVPGVAQSGDRLQQEGEARSGDRPQQEGEARSGDWPQQEGEARSGDWPQQEQLETEFAGDRSPVTPPSSFLTPRLLRPRWLWHGVGGALLAVFFVALLGNVDGGGQLMRSLAQQSTSGFTSNLPGVQTVVRAAGGLWQVLTTSATLPGYRFWDPSRVIPNTINEFPYWSFLFADLHPHMIGIPFTVLFLALAYNLLASYGQGLARPPTEPGARQQLGFWLRRLTGNGLYVAMALNLGALAVVNTWDLPTYFGLAVLVWLVREWRSGQFGAAPGRALLRTLLFAGGLGVLSVALYLPFFQHYQPLASSGVGIVKTKTEMGLWLNMWGFLFLVAVTFLLVELRRRPLSRRPANPGVVRWLRLALDDFARLARAFTLSQSSSARLGSLAVGSMLLLAGGLTATVALWLLDFKVPAALLLPLLAAALLLLRRSASSENLFVTVLAFTGLLVLLGVEFFYLKDHLQGGDWRRMNTLFKFYIQVWVMLALAGGVALPRIWSFAHERWRRGWRLAWLAAFSWLLLLSLIFPIVGTPARLDDRFPEENGRPAIGVLDGMAYMEPGVYTWHPDAQQAPTTRIELRYDYEALRWLLDNVSGTPVVAEALIGYYREGGLRVASFTGFPTLLGFHQEGEQRYGWQTGPRRSQAEEFWNTTDPQRGRQLIEELGVDYIYVGQLEHIVYPPEALAKFDQLVETGALEVVYRNDRVIIYRVV